MSLYRGAGGASDATDDSTVNAVAGYASAAASSASSAATSASNASASADAAASSASSAASSASSVSTDADNAASSASLASTYAAAASSSKDAAAASAATASTKAGEATSSASSAASDAATASTKADEAAASAVAADASADAAAVSAADALAIYGNTAAVNAAVASAAASAVTASTQALYSGESASDSAASAVLSFEYSQNSAEWATVAQGSANSAAASASSALAIYGNTSAMNQAVQTSTANAAQAVTSANAAAASASSAATSATTATTQATNAATSAAQASAVALGNEPVRHSVRPSLLLDFANTKQLDPRITFTRASTATYYDGKTVAKAEENLVTYSQDFDVTSGTWGKNSSTVSSNTTVAPDGTTTADTITLSAGTAQKGVQRSIFGGAIPYTFSIYAKAGTQSIIQLSFNWVATYYANFDLSTGTLGTVGATVTASITAVGNGWYRCSITRTDVTGVNALYIEAVDATTSGYRATTASTGDFFIWGAQLEQRSSVTAYTPTTTAPITNYIPALQTAAAGVPRFDHNPVTGESLGLLIEEQRTNLLTRSEEFDNAMWTKQNITLTANTLVAPDGTLTTDRAAISAATGTTAVHLSAGVSSTSIAYTTSVYVKAGGVQYANVGFIYSAGVFSATQFDLNAGTIVRTASASYTGASATITAIGNGWFRCTHTCTVNTATIFPVVTPSNALWTTGEPRQSLTGDGYSGIYIWGAQLEAGSFATSYIPTVASQVTRSADAASMTGTNFSSWYTADQGTLYSESSAAGQTGNGHVVFSFHGTTSNRIASGQYLASPTVRSLVVDVNEANQVLLSGAGTTVNKIAGAYRVNDFAVSINGATVSTDTSGILPIVDKAFIGSFGANGQPFTGTIRKLAYYPRRLTNAELQGLTTV